MNHKFKSIDPAEWSDTYKCIHCGYCVVYSAEDCMSLKDAEKQNGKCDGGIKNIPELLKAIL